MCIFSSKFTFCLMMLSANGSTIRRHHIQAGCPKTTQSKFVQHLIEMVLPLLISMFIFFLGDLCKKQQQQRQNQQEK